MAVTPLNNPETAVGVFLWSVVPSPSCPLLLLPQHFTAPVESNAHEWWSPAVMAWDVAFASAKTCCAGLGNEMVAARATKATTVRTLRILCFDSHKPTTKSKRIALIRWELSRPKNASCKRLAGLCKGLPKPTAACPRLVTQLNCACSWTQTCCSTTRCGPQPEPGMTTSVLNLRRSCASLVV